MDVDRFTTAVADSPTAAWPWPGRLPDGVVILEGRGGLGKSTLTADFAARVSKGSPWPDGTKSKPAGGVLLFGREDRKAVVQTRLADAGADLRRVFRITKANLASEYDEFERMIRREKVKLVVIDPAIEFLGVSMNDEEQVRWMLGVMDQTAEKFGCTMILIRHMRKDANDQDPMEDGGRGTGALRNWVRGVYRLILDPDDEKRRLFMATKFNYAEFPPTLVFENHVDRNGHMKLMWDKNPSRWNAFNLIARPKDEVKRYENRECDVWLRDYFETNGYRVKAKDALEAGHNLGFSTSTIKRARVKLNAVSTKLAAFQGEYLWTHPLYNADDDDGFYMGTGSVAPGIPISVSLAP